MKRAMGLLFLAAFLVPNTACKKKDAAKKAPPKAEPGAAAKGKTPTAEPSGSGVAISKAQLAAFAPLPTDFKDGRPLFKERIDLGRQLYYDKRLSKNHDVACNSCHLLDKFGVDNKPVSPGHKKLTGDRNSPTVYNAAGHIAQFWDGRAKDVEAQAKGPVLAPVEMAMPSEAAVVKVLRSIPGYVKAFKAAFPKTDQPVTYDNMATAIGAFERKLVTPGRWDKFLGGDAKALTDAEKKGFLVFVGAGCTACHSGALLGGGMYQKLGLLKPWPNTKDQGRFKVTKKDTDKMMFKVPSLRNIAKTGPYFHDGSVTKLDTAIRMMAIFQTGKTLTDEQATSIATFLGALTGTIPTDYIAMPTLPPSGPKTPKPDPS